MCEMNSIRGPEQGSLMKIEGGGKKGKVKMRSF
jgi:hypothetical protein